MALVSAFLVSAVVGVAVLGTTLLSTMRKGKSRAGTGRKSSHVTEVLQVDMVDRGLSVRVTAIDCSVDMESVQGELRHDADQVLQPVAGLNQTKVL